MTSGRNEESALVGLEAAQATGTENLYNLGLDRLDYLGKRVLGTGTIYGKGRILVTGEHHGDDQVANPETERPNVLYNSVRHVLVLCGDGTHHVCATR